ncbi:MAG: DUF2339 domain-containing protein [Bacteroidota bacterium]
MADNPKKLDALLKQLELLLEKQITYEKEIHALRHEVIKLKAENQKGVETSEEKPVVEQKGPDVEKVKDQPTNVEQPVLAKAEKPVEEPKPKKPKTKSDLEKFVGENLINKIGILITIIGAGIGVKYAIDNEMISPIMRIVLGYGLGLGLLGFAIRLKEKYTNFSSVLLGGALAIMYFITFAAYSFYDLIPAIGAFSLMVFFTIAAVVAALNYDRQVIALLGLIGAYTVPFLLGEDSDDYVFLFAYMAIINTGILVLAFRKYWKVIYYSAFVITWLIYAGLYAAESFPGVGNKTFISFMAFAAVFFMIFYMTALAYKLVKKEKFVIWDIIFILVNSFIFYGYGYFLLDSLNGGEDFLGLFTVANALIHFVVAAGIYRSKLADRRLFYFVTVLVLVFLTIAIPVQLDGNWVTLVWAAEAALLFWLGRSKDIPVYEYISYPLMLLAVGSIFQDWSVDYQSSLVSFSIHDPETGFTPIMNIHFLSSVLVIAAFAFINYIHFRKVDDLEPRKPLLSPEMYFAIPGILITLVYFAFEVEIENAWIQAYAATKIELTDTPSGYPVIQYDPNMLDFKTIWVINYTMIFIVILTILNSRFFRHKTLGILLMLGSVLSLTYFLFFGLESIVDLRRSYLNNSLAEYYPRTIYHILIRYASISIALVLIAINHVAIKRGGDWKQLTVAKDIIMHVALLTLASSELIHWLDMSGVEKTNAFGLSILWGIYALMLIGIGIWKRKKHVRIGAIVLLTITLLKLFFYDMANMDTIPKTIVMVSLGLLLLVISFLYNKYTASIFDDNANDEK